MLPTGFRLTITNQIPPKIAIFTYQFDVVSPNSEMEKLKKEITEDADESFYDLYSNSTVSEFGTHDVCYNENDFMGFNIDDMDHDDHNDFIREWKKLFSDMGFRVSELVTSEYHEEG